MEYIPEGDLESNVVARTGKLSESQTRDITQQILSGLEIMHAESFAHRDLKPQVSCPKDSFIILYVILILSGYRTF